MIQATPSAFHSSHVFKFTGFSAPLSNNSNVPFETTSKKRKIADHVERSTLPVDFTSEGSHIPVHEIIKKECEELIELIVHLLISIPLLSTHPD